MGFPLAEDLVAAPGLVTGMDNNGRWLTNAGLNPGMSGGPAFDRLRCGGGIVAGGYEEAQSLNLLIPLSFATSLLQSVNSPLLTPQTGLSTPSPAANTPEPIPNAPNRPSPTTLLIAGLSEETESGRWMKALANDWAEKTGNKLEISVLPIPKRSQSMNYIGPHEARKSTFS